MGRFVELLPTLPPSAPEATTEGSATPVQGREPKGDPVERIVKYMPVEIVSGYVFVLGLTQAVQIGLLRTVAAWMCFAAGLIATPLFLLLQKPKPEQRPQILIATVAFVLWAYLLGGPFALDPLDKYYSAALGSVAVGLYTWLVGLFYMPRER